MAEWIPQELIELFSLNTLWTLLRILMIVLVGIIVLKIIQVIIGRTGKRRITPQSMMILKKAIRYTGLFVIFLLILQQLNLNMAAILGAAGVVGIAVGFAAQTSISNIISGLFILSEKAFAVDDVIKVGDTVGIVMSIDLLSVKIRSFDNQYIRIPNESLIKSEFTNITRFPIRRLNIEFLVEYGTDIPLMKETLFSLAKKNVYCLDNPEPLFLLIDFDKIGIKVLFGVWFAKADYINLKNSIMQGIEKEFRENGIRIPVALLLREDQVDGK